jgi:hypothetical protein
MFLRAITLTLFQGVIVWLSAMILGEIWIGSLLLVLLAAFIFGKIIGAHNIEDGELRELAFKAALVNALLAFIGALPGFFSDGGGYVGFASFMLFLIGILGMEGIVHFFLTMLGLKAAEVFSGNRWS